VDSSRTCILKWGFETRFNVNYALFSLARVVRSIETEGGLLTRRPRLPHGLLS
jgi:hypothetical protein